jgi:Uma2 family endonuclease
MAIYPAELDRTIQDSDTLVHQITRERYHQMDELGWFQGRNVELIDGVIFEHMSPISDTHAGVIGYLSETLRDLIDPKFTMRVQLPLSVSETSEPEPDIAFVLGSSRDYLRQNPVTAALVIEVSVSSLQADRLKSKVYAKAGVVDYWIVNLTDQVIDQYSDSGIDSSGETVYQSLTTFNRSDSITLIIAPAISLRVDDILP